MASICSLVYRKNSLQRLHPVTGGGLDLPDGAGPVLHIEPAWRERGLTKQEAERIADIADILLRQAQRTETPGYDPDD
jgi:hypothetical protein